MRVHKKSLKKYDTDNKCSIAAFYEVAMEIVKAMKPFSDEVLLKNVCNRKNEKFAELQDAAKF